MILVMDPLCPKQLAVNIGEILEDQLCSMLAQTWEMSLLCPLHNPSSS